MTARGEHGRAALGAVLIVGVLARAVLIPLGHGQDYTVWDLASAATLHGSNIFAQHPHYPGGPYAYSPLFLYLELPFQWLAQHTIVSFLIWGKLPIAAADVAVAMLLHRGVQLLGGTERRATWAAGLYFLNPLVLYNSAFYGRFDSLGCALLLAWLLHAAAGRGETTRSSLLYGLAVAAKTFPVFLIAAAYRSARPNGARRLLLITALVVVAVSVPYLARPLPYLRDLSYDTGKTAGGLSWWTVLHLVGSNKWVGLVSSIGLLVFAIAAALLAQCFAREDIVLCTTLTLVLFLVASKVVLEQYLTWPLASLALLSVRHSTIQARASMLLCGFLTIIGLADTEFFHPLGRNSIPLGIVLAIGCTAYLIVASLSGPRTRQRDREDTGRSRRPWRRSKSQAQLIGRA